MTRRVFGTVALFALALTPSASAATQDDVYSLVKGCYALKDTASGKYAAKGAGGYTLTAGSPGQAEVFRLQATDLGKYLLYGKAKDFLTAGSLTAPDRAAPATAPSEQANFKVTPADDGYRFTASEGGRSLTAGGGELRAAPGAGSVFALDKADGCPEYPEIEINVTGDPVSNPLPYGQTRGFIDAHMHMMAFEFLGGSLHCGRPWHAYGAPTALTDCPDHAAQGAGAAGEQALSRPGPHSTDGWPTFEGWPRYDSLTHETSYYKWLERAWRGGLRVFVNLMVENAALCEVYPLKRNSCNEMDSVRLQIRQIRNLERYIDAQAGGPGKGFFRIVTSAFEAREAINAGKLAIVQGIEVSELFNCGVYNDVPKCNFADIDRNLDEFYKLGIRDMELVNKFDNGFAGVAGDSGQTGLVTGTGNKFKTGRYFQMETCNGPSHDRPQVETPGGGRDELAGAAFGALLPPGALPIYPAEPHCNTRGLTELGEHLIRGMVNKRMIVDPDHLSVLARRQVMALLEAARYSGVISSHTWSDDETNPRILNLGGIVTPYAGSSVNFVKEYRKIKPGRSDKFFFGFGYGADMNGLGSQGPPRNPKDPVKYPFKSFDGGSTIEKQKSGTRTYDINKDGVAHYGLYPDWVEDLRKIAGDEIVADMANGVEAYLQMWERTEGVPQETCREAGLAFRANGVGRVQLDRTPEQVMRSAGQVRLRPDRAFRWCVDGTRSKGKKVVAVFTPEGRTGLVGSDAIGHKILNVGPGARTSKIASKGTKRLASDLRVRDAGDGNRWVYVVRRGRVRSVAVATSTVAKSPARLRSYLKLAGLR